MNILTSLVAVSVVLSQTPVIPPVNVAPIVDCVNHPDRDGDHHKSIACGGDDCDDNDSRRFPGNAEVCDANGHDEDCDLTTYGLRDVDGDGFQSNICTNKDPKTGAVVSHGTDCHDNAYEIRPGSVWCKDDSNYNYCLQDGSQMTATCPSPTPYCASQPNRLGVCTPKP